MAKLDWDRERREARKRKHGSTPVWADPAFVDPSVRRKFDELTERQREIVARFDRHDATNKPLNARPTRARLRGLEGPTLAKASAEDVTGVLRRLVRDWHAWADEHLCTAQKEAGRTLTPHVGQSYVYPDNNIYSFAGTFGGSDERDPRAPTTIAA
jgi:hypothetical protein